MRLSNKTWSVTCTPNHRWAVKHWRQAPLRVTDEFVTAERITSRHSLRLAAEADTGHGPVISEQDAELLGWVLGDAALACGPRETSRCPAASVVRSACADVLRRCLGTPC